METKKHDIEVLEEGTPMEAASVDECCKGSIGALVTEPEEK